MAIDGIRFADDRRRHTHPAGHRRLNRAVVGDDPPRLPVLASSGGTVPIQALPGFFGAVGHVEPLRQVLMGTRAIMYFGARGDAGLTHSLILIACELVFWALVGFAVTSWYDHKQPYRIAPDLFASISRAIDRTVSERAGADPAAATAASGLTAAGEGTSKET
jgi:hypothetical protein